MKLVSLLFPSLKLIFVVYKNLISKPFEISCLSLLRLPFMDHFPLQCVFNILILRAKSAKSSYGLYFLPQVVNSSFFLPSNDTFHFVSLAYTLLYHKKKNNHNTYFLFYFVCLSVSLIFNSSNDQVVLQNDKNMEIVKS